MCRNNSVLRFLFLLKSLLNYDLDETDTDICSIFPWHTAVHVIMFCRKWLERMYKLVFQCAHNSITFHFPFHYATHVRTFVLYINTRFLVTNTFQNDFCSIISSSVVCAHINSVRNICCSKRTVFRLMSVFLSVCLFFRLDL